MNKRELEVEKAKLKAEEQELKRLKAIYQKSSQDIAEKIAFHDAKIDSLKALDEMDDAQRSVLQAQIYQKKYQESLQKQIDGFLKDLNSKQYKSINDYIENCYKDGFLGCMYDIAGQGIPIIAPIDQKKVVKAMSVDSKISKNLYTKLGEDVDILKKRIANNISRGIAAGDSYANIARNISNASNVGFNRAMRIARTEGHRVQQQATADAQFAAKEKGADVVKQWDSTLDGKTRPNHRKLDGQLRELEEPFEVAGMKPMHPSDFGRPEEDINCRCTLLQRARWALDDDELETLKERAEYFELDKTEDFNDFKKKYLKVADKAEYAANPYAHEIQLPPHINEFSDYDEYKRATDEYIKEHGNSMYRQLQYSSDSEWDSWHDYSKNQVEQIKRFDVTMQQLQKDFPLEKNHASALVIGDYDGVQHHLTDIQKSKVGTDAQAQAWLVPDKKKYVIGLNKTGTNGTLADDLKIRADKIKKGETLSMVLDNSSEGVAIHEYGHLMSDYINQGYIHDDKAAVEYWNWYKTLSKEDIVKGVSKYAATNRGEFEAECFAELLTGNPRPIAKKYGEYLEKVSDGAIKFDALKAKESVEDVVKSSTIKVDKVISGHSSTPKKAEPNIVIDHVNIGGVVDTRGFYGEDGFKQIDLHTTNHGNPKTHPYGERGEHAHDYEWDEEGRLKDKTTREITEDERRDNGDIL